MVKTDKFVEAGQRYTKTEGKFRKQLFAMLYKLVRKGCGDGGWCECLLCRVMRVVKTEKFRNDPKYKSSYQYYQCENPATKKTRLVNWRGGQQEFTLGSEFEDVAYAPWYAIRMFQKGSNDDEGWIYWIDYAGPPQIYLTKAAAKDRAKQLRKQYTTSYRKIEVVEIGVIEENVKSKKKGHYDKIRKEAKKMEKKSKKGDWQKCSVCKTKFDYDKEGLVCNKVYVCGDVCAKKSAASRGNAYAIHDKEDNIIDTNVDGTEHNHIY